MPLNRRSRSFSGSSYRIVGQLASPVINHGMLTIIPVGRVPDQEVADVWHSALLQVFPGTQDMQKRMDGQAVGYRVLAARTVADTLSALNSVESFLFNALSDLEGLVTGIKVVHRGWAANLYSSPPRDGLRDRHSPYFTFTNSFLPDRLLIEWPATFEQNFLPAVVQVAQALRDDKRHPTFTELIVSERFWSTRQLWLITLLGISHSLPFAWTRSNFIMSR